MTTLAEAQAALQGLFPGVTITSGRRSPAHNAEVGGVPTSFHLSGQALDFKKPQGSSALAVRKALAAQGMPVTEMLDEGDHLHWGWGQKGKQPMAQSGADIFGLDQAAGGVSPASGEDIFVGSSPSVPARPKTAAGTPVATRKPRKDQALGFQVGLMKPIDNAAGALDHALQSLGVDTDAISHAIGLPGAQEAIAQRKDALADLAQIGIEPGGKGRFAGEVVSTLPFARFGPAAGGALTGAALTDAKDAGGVARDMAFGAVASKLTDLGLDKVGGMIAPQVSKFVRKLTDSGVSLTPGQAAGGFLKNMEDKATSIPILGQSIQAARQRGYETFNRAAANKALSAIGETLPENVPVGADAVAYVKTRLGEAYDAALNNAWIKPDERFANGLQTGLMDDVQKARLPRKQAADLFEVVRDKVMNKVSGQPIGGGAIKEVDSELGRISAEWRANPDKDVQAAGRILLGVKDHFRGLIGRQNPGVVQALAKIDPGWADFLRVQAASVKSGGEMFNPNQLMQSVRQGDRSAKKSATAAGKATMQDLALAGRDVLPSKVPDSGSAGRLLQSSLMGQLLAAGSLPLNLLYSELGQKALKGLLTTPGPARRSARQVINAVRPSASRAAAVAAVPK